MEWMIPSAQVVSSKALESNVRRRSSVDAYAKMDRLFARHFEMDEFLQSVFARLQKGEITSEELKKKPAVRSACLTILRGLVARANFAADQKHQMISSGNQESSFAMVAVNQELDRTLDFVRKFQEQFSPDLDLYIEILETLQKTNYLEPLEDDDCTVSSHQSSVDDK